MDKVSVYSADWCPFCHKLMDWLKSKDIEFEYINVDEPGKREEMVARTNGNQTIPTMFVGDNFWVHPDMTTLNALFVDNTPVEGTRDFTLPAVDNNTGTADHPVEASEEAPKEEDSEIWDVLMVGAGPASLAAAVYTAREDISTLIVEKAIIGGLAAITDKVDNYPGFPEGIEGMALADNLQQQAERFGAKIELDEVKNISKDGDTFRVGLAGGVKRAKTVLIGTGSEWKKLGIPGESEFYGKGVHNCATCDGAFYRDKRLVVVGGGNSAAQEALFLTKFASHIDILVRGDKWKASEVLVHEVENHDQITVHMQTTTDEIVGEDNHVTAVKGTHNGEEKIIETDGVFVFIGLRPVTYYLEGSGVELDDYGFVKTDNKLKTNIEGIFCAGDVRSGATMQIASAVGEGASAALSIREHLETR
ncbi:MAG: FAD-dependent oxidoreductase [Patescibacteria group bacterium]